MLREASLYLLYTVNIVFKARLPDYTI